ncbi:MAG TPA: hypothetical protein VGW78_04680 [Candidatus Babeliales bacterium]|jgi:D-alanine-D-alanine ligase|nr:hypothetical protein [Candidatus Babeliales bacterium]
MATLRVGVLMGGMSIEQEVSFNSGRTICDHLDTSRYQVVPIFQRYDGALFILPYRFLHRGKIADFLDRLDAEAQHIIWDNLSTYIDFVYIALHGRYGEDGTLQGMLDLLHIPYLGSGVYTSALCMDKSLQKVILTAHGIAVPQGITLNPMQVAVFDTIQKNIIQELETLQISLPFIVKPHHEGSSLGVQVVTSYEQLGEAVRYACYISPNRPQRVLIEEKIIGMEFSCISIGTADNTQWVPLSPTEIVTEEGSHFFDYTQKYMPGRAHKYTPARCSIEILHTIQDTCVRVNEILDIKTISRIDGFVKPDGTVVIVDPNTLPGMGPASFLFREAAEHNMGHADLINHLIETELRGRGIMQNDQYSSDNANQKSASKKIRIAVLFGGDSNEKEISLESGRNVVYKLSPHTYQVIPLFVTSTMQLYHINQTLLVRNSTTEIESSLNPSMHVYWHNISNLVDFVFIALHGGKGENGTIQGALEMLQIPYNGSSVLASALCMDKYKAGEVLRAYGIALPKQQLIAKNVWLHTKEALCDTIQQAIGFPAIVKPHDDGCSVMVQKVSNKQELADAIDIVFSHAKQYVLIEECIIGTELTIGVIGNTTSHALPPSQAVAAAGILSIEEKFLPGAGQNITPALLSLDAINLAQRTVEDAYRAAGCIGYARIDCFYQTAQQSPTGKERVVILEINTLPGLTPATCIFHQAAEIGISPMAFLDLIIQLGFAHHTKTTSDTIMLNPDEPIRMLFK